MLRHLRFRPSIEPSHPLPLNVRSAGHYQLEPGARTTRGPGSFLQLFWCTHGSGLQFFGKKKKRLQPGSVSIYQPMESHLLESLKEPFSYRWLTFDGASVPSLLQLFRLKPVQQAGPCPEYFFEDLDACLQDATIHGERRASVLAYQILLLASAQQPGLPGNEKDSALELKLWVDRHYQDARLNIGALSQRFKIHRSTLYRLFIRHYGVSPVQYLSRVRIRLALELLEDKTLPVADVAMRAGLPDLSYFSRLIRKQTGFSPRHYRQRH